MGTGLDPCTAPGNTNFTVGALSAAGSGAATAGLPATARASAQPAIRPAATSAPRLVIPATGVGAPLVAAGATGVPGAATLTIPSDTRTVGWWDGQVSDGARTVRETAPAPGQSGVALIAGHIDSAAAGPGALYDLKDVRPGAAVEVIGLDGHVTSWVVTGAPETVGKDELPPALWVTTGSPKLALVTCGGPFDPASGHYLDNVIVWAVPAGTGGPGLTAAGS